MRETAEKTENRLPLDLYPNTQTDLQYIVEELTHQFREIGVELDRIIGCVFEAFRPLFESTRRVLFSEELAGLISHQEELKSVATPRQWHLYQYGRYRTSKKWEHVLEKRLRKEKRRNGNEII